jgi:hypothetical protein
MRKKMILLYNPYRDELGRFASKNSSAFFTGGNLASKQKYERIRNGLSEAKKGLTTDPVEYATRKDGLGPKITRVGADLGVESAFSWTIASAAFTNGSWLGAMGTAALATAFFGGATPAATVVGGLLVGAAASAVVTQFARGLKEKYLYAYLDRKAPKDDQHISLFGNEKRGVKHSAVSITKTGAGEIGFDVAVNAFGPMVGLPASWSVINSLKLETEGTNSDDFLVMLYPYLSAMAIGLVNSISVPYNEQLESFPGFVRDGDNMVITPGTLEEIAVAIQNETVPIVNISWGDNTYYLEESEQILLYNPYRDELGRFASKNSSAMFIGGNLKASDRTSVYQANRKTRKAVNTVKKRFASGTVKHDIVIAEDWNTTKKLTGASDNVLGAFTGSKLVVSPYGLAYANRGKFFDRVVTHEAVHARRRSKGGTFNLRSKAHMELEEGSTELLTFALQKYPYNKSPYIKQMRSVAYAARRGSKNNRREAWSLVSQMHWHNDTDRGVGSYQYYANSNKFNKGSNRDIEWLLAQRPTYKLEEEIDLFRESEMEIYRRMRLVGDSPIDPESIRSLE